MMTIPIIDAAERWADAAEEVLQRHSPDGPLHYRKILELALRDKLITTDGRTPATMGAVLYRDIAERREAEKPQRFHQYGPVMFELARPEETLVAAKDEKTVAVVLRFWTDGIAPIKGHIRPGHVYSGGTVTVHSNKSHDITAQIPVTFNRMVDISSAVQTALERAAIKVHPLRHDRKLWEL
jgi:HB1, ASXL, restriction endonuclease HTH domain